MAEGWARHLKSDFLEPYSAGIETHGLNPNAVRVMAEAGVDISAHQSKLFADFFDADPTLPDRAALVDADPTLSDSAALNVRTNINDGVGINIDIQLDVIVTVCGHAHETCPVVPPTCKVVHIGFDDPPRLAQDAKTEEEVLDAYRCVRDEIRAFIETLPEALDSLE